MAIADKLAVVLSKTLHSLKITPTMLPDNVKISSNSGDVSTNIAGKLDLLFSSYRNVTRTAGKLDLLSISSGQTDSTVHYAV